MRLHHHPASYNSRRALAVAHHLDVQLEVVLCDILSGAQHAPGYRALNPNGKVPTLEDGGRVLWESLAISQYIADHRPSEFFPADPWARADITRWMAWDLAELGRASDTLLFENVLRGLFGLGPPVEAVVNGAVDKFRTLGAILEAQLGRAPFLTGSTLTLADFFVAATWESAAGSGAPVADFPSVARWHASITCLPAWGKARTAGS